MDDKFKALGEAIFYASIGFYISVFVGIVLIIALAFAIYKQITLRKKAKENSDEKHMSKPLLIANILTYILIALIIFFMVIWTVC